MSLLFLIFACNGGRNGGNRGNGDQPYDGPGSEAWGSVDITCGGPSDCLTGETCLEGVCQVDKCSAGLEDTIAPIGQTLTFLEENEVAFADTEKWNGEYPVDMYGPSDWDLDYEASVQAGSSPLADITGGDFLGRGVGMYAAVAEGGTTVEILGTNMVTHLGLAAVAIAAGDIDGDGLDELVAISKSGKTVACDVELDECITWGFGESVTGIDVTIADVDGDTLEEPILLIEYGGYQYLYGLNADSEINAQVEAWWGDGEDLLAIAAADLNGDHIAEVIGLQNDGCWDWCNDSLTVYSAADDGVEGSFNLTDTLELEDSGTAIDLDAGDTDVDQEAEVIVLGEDATAWLLAPSYNGFEVRASGPLGTSVAPDRVAMADHDGNSPMASLEETSTCEGNVVPVMLMIPPPYAADYSNGVSSVSYGGSDDQWETFEDTVSMGLGVDVGYTAKFSEVFSASVGASVGWNVSNTQGLRQGQSVGARYGISADPEMYGPHYGGVVLSWGCFDAYKYRVSDPEGFLGRDGDDEYFVMTVPSGGGVGLWSTNRYNAMAEAGGLPIVEVPYTIGDVDSYPTSPTRVDGQALTKDEMLFPNPSTYYVSDVGGVSWRFFMNELEFNSTRTSYDFGTSAGITAFGVKVGVNSSYGFGSGYSLTVGSGAFFSGGLPPLPDDPDTPEDEYALNKYGVVPYVYQQPYTTPEGEEAAYYVMTYAVE